MTNARLARQDAKRKLSKDYKHLKQDKLGDKGKELYSKGKRITTNDEVTRIMLSIGSASLSAAAYNVKTGNISKVAGRVLNGVSNKKVNDILGIAGAGLVAAGGVKKAIDYSQRKKLSAYYTHTPNY